MFLPRAQSHHLHKHVLFPRRPSVSGAPRSAWSQVLRRQDLFSNSWWRGVGIKAPVGVASAEASLLGVQTRWPGPESKKQESRGQGLWGGAQPGGPRGSHHPIPGHPELVSLALHAGLGLISRPVSWAPGTAAPGEMRHVNVNVPQVALTHCKLQSCVSHFMSLAGPSWATAVGS